MYRTTIKNSHVCHERKNQPLHVENGKREKRPEKIGHVVTSALKVLLNLSIMRFFGKFLVGKSYTGCQTEPVRNTGRQVQALGPDSSACWSHVTSAKSIEYVFFWKTILCVLLFLNRIRDYKNCNTATHTLAQASGFHNCFLFFIL